MRKPTEEQIKKWKSDAVYYERTQLPPDHPRKLRYGGPALAEVRRDGQNGVSRLRGNGLYDEAEIKQLAWGDVDLDKVRAEKVEREERRALAHKLAVLAGTETVSIERLRTAVAMLETTSIQ